jgi:hypothetical protein
VSGEKFAGSNCN